MSIPFLVHLMKEPESQHLAYLKSLIDGEIELTMGEEAPEAAAFEVLVAGESGKRPKLRRPTKGSKAAASAATPTVSEELTVIEMGHRLIVRATPEKMREVEALIVEFDVDDAKTEFRIYSDFSPGTDIEGVAETLRLLLGSCRTPAKFTRMSRWRMMEPSPGVRSNWPLACNMLSRSASASSRRRSCRASNRFSASAANKGPSALLLSR